MLAPLQGLNLLGLVVIIIGKLVVERLLVVVVERLVDII